MKAIDIDRAMEILKEEFPRWSRDRATVKMMMEVHRFDPYRHLIMTILSAQTRDDITAPVAKKLFEVAPTPEKLANMPVEEIEKIIKPLGFYRKKARYIKEAARMIVEEFGGKVPNDPEKLMRIPGVGRKVANVFLSHVYGKDVIGVDVHVHRISNRWNLVKTKTPEQTERELYKVLPRKYWKDYNLYVVALGQAICGAKPKCYECPLKEICPYEPKNLKGPQ